MADPAIPGRMEREESREDRDSRVLKEIRARLDRRERMARPAFLVVMAQMENQVYFIL